MEDQLVSFEVTKLAKEKGFNVYTIYYYDSFGTVGSGNQGRIEWNNSNTLVAAPTQSLLQKWLRKKHNIHLMIDPGINGFYAFIIFRELGKCRTKEQYKNSTWVNTQDFPEKTYEDALELGLQKALESI